MGSQLFQAIFAALCFASWPLITRFTNLPSTWVALLVTLGTVLVTAPTAALSSAKMPSANLWLVLVCVIAGMANGLAFNPFGKLAMSAEAATYIPIVLMLMVVFTAIGSRIFYGDAFSVSKAAGIALACVAIWLLNR